MVEKASTGHGAAMVLPPPAGNRRAATHGAFIQRFTPSEQAEIAELAERAGHARASMSLDVYSHVMPLDELSQEALETLLGLRVAPIRATEAERP
jgi:hypothetical protein